MLRNNMDNNESFCWIVISTTPDDFIFDPDVQLIRSSQSRMAGKDAAAGRFFSSFSVCASR